MKSTDRRTFLRLSGSAGLYTVVAAPGCGYYEPEYGPAFRPWDFPRAGLSPELHAVHAAILAASPHNTQPWRFEVSDGRIDLFAVKARNLGAMDSLRREMAIGLGCALENMVQAAQSGGDSADVVYSPDHDNSEWVARVTFGGGHDLDGPDLYAALAHRRTNRHPYLNAPLAARFERELRELAAADPGIVLHFIDNQDGMARFRQDTIDATRTLIGDTEMLRDSDAWYRHTLGAIERSRDGVTLDAAGADALTRVGGKLLSRPDAETAAEYWLRATEGHQTQGSAFGILSTTAEERNSQELQLRVGRLYQRLHLWATREGLGMQPLNQLAELQDREESQKQSPEYTQRLANLMDTAERGAQMLFRIGYAERDALRSPRRPLEWVVES